MTQQHEELQRGQRRCLQRMFCVPPLLVLATAFGLTTASCVLPEDDEAGILQEIPEDLYTTTTAVPVTTEPEPEEISYELNLFWHDQDGRLLQIVRKLDAQPSIEDVLADLVNGPSEEEQLLDSAVNIIPRVVIGLEPIATMTENNVLVINVATDFELGAREDDKVLITEELVCTLTNLAGVSALRVFDGEGEIPLSGDGNRPIAGAAAPADFGDCLIIEEPSPDPAADGTTEDETSENEDS